ncbi:MAG: DUF3592 domain-containing protein [Treponema sp.]|nr:DUF3592 domain-containing protein [Treponema sp.]
MNKEKVAILLIIFGAVWCIGGIGIFIKDEVFKLNAIETSGTVVGYEEYNRPKSSGSTTNSKTYSIKYSYFDENKKQHVKTATGSSNPPEYKIGSKIKVFYAKTDFDKAIYDSIHSLLLYSLFGIGGFIIFIIGFIVYKYRKDIETAFSV